MIKAILFDFSRVLLFPKDRFYPGGLNELHKKLSQNPSYNFLDNFELNHDLMNFLEKMSKKIPVYMFTSENIQEAPEIKNEIEKVFKRVFSAKKIGLEKSNSESYKMIAKELNIQLNEIFYTDDKNENIRAAKLAGCYAVQYKNNFQIISKLKGI